MIYTMDEFQKVGQLLKSGKIGIIPTDTIYGITGSALISKTVEKIYKLRNRSLKKPMIILIHNLNDLNQLSIKLNPKTKKILRKIWPNPISVILECSDPNLYYLHRGTKTLAFRFPDNKLLLEILKISGPLVAPSANPQGKKPSQTVEDALNYFGKKVDFYMDGGKIINTPSTIIKLKKDKITLVRKGAKEIV